MATIQGIYVALFGRPADPEGLQFWSGLTDNGSDLTELVGRLTAEPEALARFDNLDSEAVVRLIYQSIFGRAPDPAGLAFYISQLESGAQSLETIAINILDGARGTDLLVAENKIETANLFTASLDTPEEIAAYVGDSAADIARELLQGVTADPATIPTQAQVDDKVKQVETGVPTPEPEPQPQPQPQPLTLETTLNADTLTGSTVGDTFNAQAAGSLQSTDTLIGGAGNDVLNISAGAFAADEDLAPTLQGIETINNADSARLYLTNASGLEQVNMNFTGSGPSAAQRFSDASTGTKFTFVNADAESTLSIRLRDLTDEPDTIKIGVVNSTGPVTLYMGEAPAENVDVELSNDAGRTHFHVNNEVDTITVHGTGDLLYATQTKSFSTFDAGGLAGDVTIARTGDGVSSAPISFSDAAKITTGSGNDWMNFRDSSGNLTISTGDGNDTITGGRAGNTINGGAGNDTMTGGAGADTFVFDGPGFGADTINAFQSGTDRIDVSFYDADAVDWEVVGGNTVITVESAGTITLVGTTNFQETDLIQAA